MYEHYERHRTDNITDPALRRAHPISTISGWDRDRSDSNGTASSIQAAGDEMNSQINGNGASVSPSLPSPSSTVPPMKISKSEQTDENDIIDSNNVKCVCEEENIINENEMVDRSVTDTTVDGITNGIASDTDTPIKQISSISNITQVYNEQLAGSLCNGNDSDDKNMIDKSIDNETVSIDNPEMLRKSLEIDSHDVNEESREIAEEIVEEILNKSENLLDECKRTLDHDTENDSSSVIKDEEIEHAVSEVVKGVREIEKMVKQDIECNNKIDIKIENVMRTGEADNQKTDLELSSAIVENKNNKNIVECDNETTSMNEIDEETHTNVVDVDEIVTEIVNDVIDNCVNQQTTATTTDTNDDDNINNNNNKTTDLIDTKNETITNDNNNCVEENVLQNTNDSNDNAIIISSSDTVETIQAQATDVVNKVLNEAIDATKTVLPEETNEQIASSIVNEIVDICVATDDTKNNNNNNNAVANNSSSSIDDGKSHETIQSNPEIAQPSNKANDDVKEFDDSVNQSKPMSNSSISTSTQVENNTFGNCNFINFVALIIIL